MVFTIPIGCPREVRCPRNVRGVFWLHVFMTFWMQHLTWRLRGFCIALACSLGVFLPWRKLCFSSANGATQSNCSIEQRLCSENPIWNSCSRFPSRAWRIERYGLRYRNNPIAHWHGKVDAIPCIHAIYGLPLCHRANDNGSLSFIEWAKNCPQQ